MRGLLAVAIASAVGCADSDEIEPPAGDPGCIQANAIVGAYWPNSPGYCSGNTFVACDGNTAVPMDCGEPCFHYAVPRTILDGCNLDEPHASCESGGIFTICDGADQLVCYGGRLFSRKSGGCSAPAR